jgi:Ca-activated chloride channel family protein
MIPFERFANPWALLLLGVPLIIAVLGERGRVLVMPFDHREHPPRRCLRAVLGTMGTLPPILLALVIIMVARPQSMRQPKALRTVTNIQICLDVSGSMIGERYANAAHAIEEFTRLREGDAMGLTVFSGEPVRWVPLTRDLQAVRNALKFTNPESTAAAFGGGTAIGAALRHIRENIDAEATEGDRLIILVSDGASPDAQDGRQYELARELSEAGCVVYYIHIARDEGMVPEVAELAQLTGGEAMAAADPRSLSGVFRHIDRMRPAQIIPQAAAPTDDLRWLAFAALAAAGLHGIGLLGLRYTPW